jgi:iron complex outermembrane receptor protein
MFILGGLFRRENLGFLLTVGLAFGPVAALAQEDAGEQPATFEGAPTVEEVAFEPGVTGTVGDTSTAGSFGEVEAKAMEADPAAAGMSPAQAKRIEEIVVSARRRDELLEDTPVAVTALTPGDLINAGVTNILQIGELVPNLIVVNSGAGAAFVIRGIGAFPAPYFDQGTGLYLDGVYIPRQQGNVMEMVDIRQIEVLRGPQGTLFGKNSAGGAIKITTAAPEPELGAFARVRATTNDLFQTRATLNLPLNFGSFQDRLATRLSFATTNQKGYVENEFLQTSLANQNNLGFLGALRFLATEDLVLDVSGMWNQNWSRGGGPQCTFVQDSQFAGIFDLAPPLGPADYNQASYEAACRESERYTNSLNVPQVSNRQSWMLWSTATWDVGELGFLEDVQTKFLTSYRQYEGYLRADLDGTEFDIFEVDNTGRSPFGGSPDGGWSITEEVQFAGSALDGRFNFVSGLFGSMESSHDDSVLLVIPDTLADTAGGTTVGTFTTNNWDWSVFGQADFAVTEWFSTTGGIRFERAKKEVDRLRIQPVEGAYPGPVACQPGTGPGNADADGRIIPCEEVPTPNNRVPNSGTCAAGTGPVPVFDESGNIIEFLSGDAPCEPESWERQRYFTNWSPMVSARFIMPDELLGDGPIDHLMGYLQFARGFKNGGFNGGALDNDPRNRASFDSEIADTFEVGLKTISFDQILTANFTWFVTQYQNLQLPTVETLFPAEGCVPPEGLDECLPVAATFTRNVPKATIRGFEFEFTARPLEWVNISGNLGLQDARLGEFRTAENPLTGEQVDVSGSAFSFVPAINSHMAVSFPFPVDIPGYRVFSGLLEPRIDWNYQSKVQWFSPSLNDGATPNAALQDPYHLVNLRLNYIFNDGNTSVAVFGENMTDVEVLNGVLAVGQRVLGTVLRYYGQGRSFGLEVTHSF